MSGVTPRTLEIYFDSFGKAPFNDWLCSLDVSTRARIRSRLDRMEVGNFGDCEPVGEGVFELRMFFGPGYRIYFAEKNRTLVLLLCAGDKKTQQKDIKSARQHWKEYKERKQ